MEVRRAYFALSLFLKFYAILHSTLINNPSGNAYNKKRLLYFKVKSDLCNIRADGSEYLWCLCHDMQTRRHIGLRGRHSYFSGRKSRSFLILKTTLLLISGDVSPNPGPVKYPCAVCSRPVASTHRAILCDDCGKWCHIGPKCGKVKVEDYNSYIRNDNLEWTCPKCRDKTRQEIKNSSQSLELEGQAHMENGNRRNGSLDVSANGLAGIEQQQHLNLGPLEEQTTTEDIELEVFKTLKEELKSKGLSVGHANVRGLCKHLNEVRILLENTPLDVLALTETHLNSNINDNELSIDGYSIKRKDRHNREGGGCAIYYKESLDTEEIEKYNTEGLEMIWLEIKLCSQRLLIGCVYRPPDVSTFYEKFQVVLENIWATRKNILITGDFNSDMLLRNQSEVEKYLGKKLKNILGNFGLKNVIKSPTRITDTTKTIIDLIIVSDLTKLQCSGVLDYQIADHKFVYAVLKLRKKNMRPAIRTVKNYKKFDQERFRQELSNTPWWVCSTFDDLEDSTWAWDTIYKNVVKDHVSTRRAKIRQKSLPWIDGKIRKEMNKRYKLLKACDGTDKTSDTWKEYKKIKNKVTKMLRKAEAQYWENQFSEAQQPKDFWKLVNKIRGKRTNKSIGLLNDKNGDQVTSDDSKAELMNNFFINIGEELAAKFTTNNTENQLEHIYRITPTVDHLSIDTNKLKKDLRGINPKKACGHDNNSSKDLAAASDTAAEGLNIIFQKSAHVNQYPETWKKARVLTAFKKGVKSEISNYRPLSMLSIPGKLLESQACKAIDDHLDNHNLLSNKQWGFRKGRSTEGLLLTLTERWKRDIDDGKIIGVVFIDFKKSL